MKVGYFLHWPNLKKKIIYLIDLFFFFRNCQSKRKQLSLRSSKHCVHSVAGDHVLSERVLSVYAQKDTVRSHARRLAQSPRARRWRRPSEQEQLEGSQGQRAVDSRDQRAPLAASAAIAGTAAESEYARARQ